VIAERLHHLRGKRDIAGLRFLVRRLLGRDFLGLFEWGLIYGAARRQARPPDVKVYDIGRSESEAAPKRV
jgi:hypothetical protein